MKIELSVIIVNYNGLRFLKDCFDSLEAKLRSISFEIIVVDNDSKDESCSFIKENYPTVVLVESKENLGFGKGNNVGASIARGNYLLLFNNDTILLDDLQTALNYMKSDSKIGVVGINMLNAKKEYLQAVGVFPNPTNLFKLKNLLQQEKEFQTGIFSKDNYEVDWLIGSFLMLPKAVYNEVGGFDEDYFMYVEDIDLCKKIEEAGYKRVFLPKFSYIHYVGYNKRKNPLLIQGFELYISKHLRGINKAAAGAALNINKVVKSTKAKLSFN